jgi:hypothetical protein
MHNTTPTPRRVRSFVQDIRAPLEDVFPLLCPEREKQWLPGWDARMLHSASGVAERGAIFETKHDAGRTLWIVTEHDPPRRVAFARWQPDGLMVHIEITLARQHTGSTALCICYTYTAVDAAGVTALAALNEEAWLKNMSFWQGSMNAWFEKQPPSGSPHR